MSLQRLTGLALALALLSGLALGIAMAAPALSFTLRVALAAAALGAALLAGIALARTRRQLASAAEQARDLLQGRFVVAPAEGLAAELRPLAQAMNAMVERLKSTFEVQAAQLEQLRQQAHVDALTGLPNRRHFLAQLDAALQREDGAGQRGLVLLRLRDIAGINRALGHAATDRILEAIAQALRPYAERAPGCLLGRLNGADFALCLPVGGLALETAQALAGAMRAVLPSVGAGVAVALGCVELAHATPLAHALADADEALARAEARGAFAVELIAAPGDARSAIGEGQWQRHIGAALAGDGAQLAEFALRDAAGDLIHLECPLRLQLAPGGEFEPAARWLPLALRTRQTGEADACAVALALAAIERDGRPRGVNLAAASLADGAFAARLNAQLFAAPRAARKLSLEVAEAAALERLPALRELARRLRACDVRLGLEHAGAELGRIDHLFDAGFDFVKLDAAITQGAGSDVRRAEVVRATVALLHAMAIAVYAEGVADDADAQALWACGVDGITGPWASRSGR